MSTYTEAGVRAHLAMGPTKIKFYKVDGSVRVMDATLRMSDIPSEEHPTGAKKSTPGLINVWDTEANAWRSFKLDKLISMGDVDISRPAEPIQQEMTPTTKFGEASVAGKFWGYHLALDCGKCDKDDIRSAANIAQFATALVEAIKMKAYGPPQVVFFAGHNLEVAGHTLTQLIETSLVSGHFVDATGDCYLDIFSCAPFDVEAAIKVVSQYFSPRTVTKHILLRRAD